MFLGGAVICDRIAKIKGYLKIYFAKFSKPTVAESLSKLLEIDSIDLKGHLESRTISFRHNQVFMSFRFIRNISSMNLVSEYIKERIKWYASKSFKYEIVDHDPEKKIYLLKKKRELGGSGKSTTFGDESKVIVVGNTLFCTCLDQFYTGIP